MKTMFLVLPLAALLPAALSLGQSVTPGAPITENVAPDKAPQKGPHTITLKSGERITGLVTGGTDDTIVIQSDALGSITLQRAMIDTVIGPDGKPESSVAALIPADPGLFGSGILSGWTRQAEAGVTGTSGTTRNANGDIQVNATTDNKEYRSTIGAYWFYSTSEGDVTRNQTRVFGTYDKRLNDGPWFVFGRAQYDNDSLESYENRLSAFAGPGYEFVRNDKYELLGRIGIGYTSEFGGNYPDGYDRSRIEALVGLDGKWVIDPTQSLVGSIYYYPSLEDIGYGRIVSTAAYQIDISQSKGLAFKAGIEHDYDLHPVGNDSRNNVNYFANIVLKL